MIVVKIGADQVDHHRRAVDHRRRQRQAGNRPQMQLELADRRAVLRQWPLLCTRGASSLISSPSAVTKHSIAITPT